MFGTAVPVVVFGTAESVVVLGRAVPVVVLGTAESVEVLGMAEFGTAEPVVALGAMVFRFVGLEAKLMVATPVQVLEAELVYGRAAELVAVIFSYEASKVYALRSC